MKIFKVIIFTLIILKCLPTFAASTNKAEDKDRVLCGFSGYDVNSAVYQLNNLLVNKQDYAISTPTILQTAGGYYYACVSLNKRSGA